jgi:hypothetical protein
MTIFIVDKNIKITLFSIVFVWPTKLLYYGKYITDLNKGNI